MNIQGLFLNAFNHPEWTGGKSTTPRAQPSEPPAALITGLAKSSCVATSPSNAHEQSVLGACTNERCKPLLAYSRVHNRVRRQPEWIVQAAGC